MPLSDVPESKAGDLSLLDAHVHHARTDGSIMWKLRSLIDVSPLQWR